MHWRTSSPSTVSEDCARPAGAGPPRRGSPVSQPTFQWWSRGGGLKTLLRDNYPIGADRLILLAAFALASALAGLFGAINLGTALTFGQIAFAVSAVAVIVRRA